jgi:hypothetical protein
MSKQIEFLVKQRDAFQMAADSINEYLESLAPPEVKAEKPAIVVNEEAFTCLSFEKQNGAKLGEFEVAREKNNIAEKWVYAYGVLQKSNATINNRYHGNAFVYSYWLYGNSKIYRQKLKAQK